MAVGDGTDSCLHFPLSPHSWTKFIDRMRANPEGFVKQIVRCIYLQLLLRKILFEVR